MSNNRLRVLIVDDVEEDASLIEHELSRGFEVSIARVDSLAGLHQALEREAWDLLITDFSLPQLTGMDVLHALKGTGLDLPSIVISGTIDEEAAVEALRAGARDFISKNRLARLVPAVNRELNEYRERREKRAAKLALIDARERMRFALQTAGVGTWEVDFASGKSAWSDVLESLHGIPVGTFGGNRDAFLAAVHQADRQRLRERLEEAVRDETGFRFEYRTVWGDGSIHWIASVGRTIFNDGKPVRAAGVGMDITAQKGLEDQVRHAQRIDSVGNLAGGIAHDFNNLLTAILGFSNLLLEEPFLEQAPAQFRKDLEQIRVAGERASVLTGQLLAFSRKQVLQPTVLDLNKVVDNLTPMLRRLFNVNIGLVNELRPGLDAITADVGQLEQVLMNLVVNARDAMPDGGTITVRTSNVELDRAYARDHVDVLPGHYVRLDVSDSGIGMPPEVKARLFEPFFTTKPVGRGTGLGLATVFGIVKQHDGHITVETEPGRGTTFSVFFPRAHRDAETAAPAAVSLPDARGENVLLVEDDSGVRALARLILTRAGFHVVEAATADAALDLVATGGRPIDLLITDLVLPGGSGNVLASDLAKRFPALRVLYMSGYTDDVLLRNGGLAGSTFLHKPFTPVSLMRAVGEALGRT